MNVLYISLLDLSTTFGGAEIQILNTKNTLLNKYAGINIICKTFDTVTEDDLVNVDILHIWNIISAPLEIIKKAKEKNIKIVISSIFWNITDSILINYFPLSILYIFTSISIFKILLIFIINYIIYNIVPQYKKRKNQLFLSNKRKNITRLIVSLADSIIPNSIEEANYLFQYINSTEKDLKNKVFAIPNAVNIDFLKRHNENNFMPDIKDFILEAGRIEPLKHQLGLIKALYKNPEIPIILAGGIGDEKYYQKVKKLAEKRGNVYFTGKIPPNDLFSLYKRAKVHVLASFRESPGLATLEALMCGSQIVVSNEKYCPIKYYKFDKYGFVCNPYDVKSIRNAILEAYNNPKDINLPDDYIKFFSYENVADMTYEVYKNVLKEL